MHKEQRVGIDRSNLSDAFRAAELQKSNLILEANLLQHQGEYEAAADKFTLSAEIEEQLANQLLTLGKQDKAFIHQFSALSYWGQAGDLHRALRFGYQLLQLNGLSTIQRKQVADYLDTLRNRLGQWMQQWALEAMTASN